MSDLTLRQHLEAAEAALADAAVRDGHEPSMDAVGHIMAAQAILDSSNARLREGRFHLTLVPDPSRTRIT